jgi:hypothetical protein
VADSINRTTVAVVDGVRTVASAVDLGAEGVALNGTALKGLVGGGWSCRSR